MTPASLAPPPSATRTVPLPIASRQGGSGGTQRQRDVLEAERHMMHPDLAQHRAVRRAVDDMAGAAEADDGHPRRERGAGAGGGVLDREALRRIDAEPSGGGKVDVGVRLAAVPAVGAVDMLAEMMAEPEQAERPADIFGAARRGDRARHRTQRVEEGGRAGDRVEALHEARPCARPVLFAEIGGQRPPKARLDPPLRFLPIVAVIVAQALVVGRRHAHRGQALGERQVRTHLAVGDHAVEVEDDRGGGHRSASCLCECNLSGLKAKATGDAIMKFISLKSRGGNYLVVADNVAWLRDYENGQVQVGMVGGAPLLIVGKLEEIAASILEQANSGA